MPTARPPTRNVLNDDRSSRVLGCTHTASACRHTSPVLRHQVTHHFATGPSNEKNLKFAVCLLVRSHGSTPESDAGGGYSAELVEKAEALLQDLREGKITKSEALGRLFVVLDVAGDGEDQPARHRAFQSYWTDIEKEAELQAQATARGERIIGGAVRRERHRREKSAEAAAQDALAGLERLIPKRARPGPGDVDDDGDGESDFVSKHPRLDREQLPWAGKDDDFGAAANTGGVENRKLLRLFAHNPRFVVADLRNSASAPAGFPTSEWNNIVRGTPINLDNVLSHLHHVNPPKESVGRLGDREITFGEPKPTRVVESAADWHASWVKSIAATSFVFPHRRDELEQYGEHIMQLFAAKVPSAAGKVIMYDRAIRNFIGGGQRHSLTDTASYSNLREAILSVDGVEAHRSAGGSKGRGHGDKGGRRSDKVCERFNRKTGCSFDDARCKYKHTCKSCGSAGHGESTCQGAGGKRS
ncbi:hypothetical protein DFP72DRAFT_835552 [Ephemerocybe angulata]|uniref:C3H1-type domain-containing protein n=1 Tax=Ephemerocybe angulata TaxID=980116 RepID=A0A8H6H5U9_9AGAR|nr:hypothetical protein DFP72DRAFT_835552 [Tulosesus angulatus]